MLLRISSLNTYYGASHVLRGISLDVAPGEVVALLGRNGMGKSTVLKSVMGLVRPQSGSVSFAGGDITGHAPFKVARAGVGYVPDERRIFPDLSVLDNLLLGVKGGKAADPGDPRLWTLERIFGHFPRLRERQHHKGRFLSGGEQQMLAIGRALMGNPRVLLMDEPSEGLAPLIVAEVGRTIARLKEEGQSILLVEQNVKLALDLADDVVILNTGRIAFNGTAEQVRLDQALITQHLGVF